MQAMKKIRVLLPLILALAFLPAFGQQNSSTEPSCNLTAISPAGPNTATVQIIAAPASTTSTVFQNGAPVTVNTSQRIKICAVYISITQTATPANYNLMTGTGTNCATGGVNLTAPVFGTASVKEQFKMEGHAALYMVAPRATALCLKLSAAVTDAQVTVIYKLGN